MTHTFTPLRVRSHGSLLVGVASPEALLERAASLGYTALGLTDRDNLYLAIRFLDTAESMGLQPVLGAELTARSAPGGPGGPVTGIRLPAPGARPRPASVLLLPIDRRGWSNLCALITARMLDDGFDLVRAVGRHHAGLHVIAESPGLIAALVAEGVPPALGAADTRARTAPHRGGLWLGVRGLPLERAALRARHAAARALRVPAVATGDVLLLTPRDHEAHRAAVTAAAGELLERMPRSAFGSPDAWLASPDEWTRRVRATCAGAGAPELATELLENNAALVERVRLTLERGTPIFPTAPLPAGVEPAAHLRVQAEAGFARRYAERPGAGGLARAAAARHRARARARLDEELGLIAHMGFTDYFLLVAEIVGFARARGIPTVGRGSGASSIVSYALGVTSVDPIRYGLCFERFLHPQRRDCPDLDVDLCWQRRDEVIAHVYDAYGHDRVAMISTHATLGPRSAFREAAKALGLPLGRVNALARRVPRDLDASAIEAALEGGAAGLTRTLGHEFGDARVAEALRLAARLGGAPRHLSIHCGGLVIGDQPLTHYLPLERSAKGVIVSQFEMRAVERVGLVKMDLLGNRALTTIGECVALVASSAVGAGAGGGGVPSGARSLPHPAPARSSLACSAILAPHSSGRPLSDTPPPPAPESTLGDAINTTHSPIAMAPASPTRPLAPAGSNGPSDSLRPLPTPCAADAVADSSPCSTGGGEEGVSARGRPEADGARMAELTEEERTEAGGTRDSGSVGERAPKDTPSSPPPAQNATDDEHDSIPDDDPLAAASIAAGDTLNCFQLESPAMRHLLRMLACDSLDATVAAVALVRPGAAESGAKEVFARRRRGLEGVAYPHESLRDTLAETYGTLLYEEDVMRVAHAFCGLPYAEGEVLRRAIAAARDDEEFRFLERGFVAQALRAGRTAAEAHAVWCELARFAGYAFCKAHAAGYGALGWQCAALRARHPAAWAVGILHHHAGMYPTWVHVEDLRRGGPRLRARTGAREWLPQRAPVTFRGPCLVRSQWTSALERGAVRVGLHRVAGLAHATGERLLAARAEAPFASLADVIDRARPTPPELDALIRAGACDAFGRSRAALLLEARVATQVGAVSHRAPRGERVPALGGAGRWLPVAAAPRPGGEALPELPEFSPADRVRGEFAATGLWFAAHPLDVLLPPDARTGVTRARDVERAAGRRVRVVGIPCARRRVDTKTGGVMAFVTLADETGLVECVVFPDAYKRLAEALRGEIVTVEGRVDATLDAVTVVAERATAHAAGGFGDGWSGARTPQEAGPPSAYAKGSGAAA